MNLFFSWPLVHHYSTLHNVGLCINYSYAHTKHNGPKLGVHKMMIPLQLRVKKTEPRIRPNVVCRDPAIPSIGKHGDES